MTKTLSLLYLLTLLMSCDRPACKNTNPLFDQYTADHEEYKQELARELKRVDAAELTFWVASYQEKNGLPTINANIQGDGLCSVIALTIGESRNGIEDVITKKGGGYRGAELKDLKFEVVQNGADTKFLFRSVSSIID